MAFSIDNLSARGPKIETDGGQEGGLYRDYGPFLSTSRECRSCLSPQVDLIALLSPTTLPALFHRLH